MNVSSRNYVERLGTQPIIFAYLTAFALVGIQIGFLFANYKFSPILKRPLVEPSEAILVSFIPLCCFAVPAISYLSRELMRQRKRIAELEKLLIK